jgi:regulator of replication initiation timing
VSYNDNLQLIPMSEYRELMEENVKLRFANAALSAERDRLREACEKIQSITKCKSNDARECQDQLYQAFTLACAALARDAGAKEGRDG